MRSLVVGFIVVCAASCGPQGVFRCGLDEQCISPAGVRGTCEATSFCSFEDHSCDSGQRYGHYAGDGLDDQCVLVAQDGGSGSDRPHEGCGQPHEDCCPDNTCQNGATCVAGRCPDD